MLVDVWMTRKSATEDHVVYVPAGADPRPFWSEGNALQHHSRIEIGSTLTLMGVEGTTAEVLRDLETQGYAYRVAVLEIRVDNPWKGREVENG